MCFQYTSIIIIIYSLGICLICGHTYFWVQAYNVWGIQVQPNLKPEFFKAILLNNKKVSLEDAIFRNESSFIPANLQNFYDFWDKEILKDHPHKENLLKWIKGVEIEEFLNSYTFGEFQGMKLDSYYPQPKEFSNYVPEEFIPFMDQQVQEWVTNGALLQWDKVTKEGTLTSQQWPPLW